MSGQTSIDPISIHAIETGKGKSLAPTVSLVQADLTGQLKERLGCKSAFQDNAPRGRQGHKERADSRHQGEGECIRIEGEKRERFYCLREPFAVATLWANEIYSQIAIATIRSASKQARA